MTPFDWVNDLSGDKKYLLDIENLSAYPAFIVNRGLANNLDCILLCQQMNLCSGLHVRMQHDFYFYAVQKRKRYGKWVKGTVADAKTEKLVDMLQKYYTVNREKAIDYLALLKEDEIKRIKKIMGH